MSNRRAHSEFLKEMDSIVLIVVIGIILVLFWFEEFNASSDPEGSKKINNFYPILSIHLLGIVGGSLLIWKIKIGTKIEKIDLNSESIQEIKNLLLQKEKPLNLEQDEFYELLREKLIQANEEACLMYYEPYPPTKAQRFKNKERYFQEKYEIITRKNKGFLVKQIVSIENKEKYEWVKESLIDPFEGVASFDLKCVGIKYLKTKTDFQLPPEIFKDFVDGIAVTILDCEHIFIIPVRNSRSASTYSDDYYRCDVSLVKTFRRYFDELWESPNCIELMSKGNINLENVDYVKNAISKMK